MVFRQRRQILGRIFFLAPRQLAMKRSNLTPVDALIIVDFQNDFCPGGALPVQSCAEVLPALNTWIDLATQAGAIIVASRDWHPPDHISFHARGGRWSRHCVRDSAGAEFRPGLNLPDKVHIISKGTDEDRDAYSAFDGTGLVQWLRDRGVHRVWVAGLALDVCVRATVLDALSAGFETHVIREATSPVEPEGGRQALDEMRQAGAIIE
jgi:nicotinamidase/pyrazinamidase